MLAPEKRALASACDWLAGFSPATSRPEEQIDRLFGIWACVSGLSYARRYVAVFRRKVRGLAQFEWFRYTSDPLFALAVYRAMKSFGFQHDSLQELNDGYSSILRDDATYASSLGMIADLLRASGSDPGSLQRRAPCIPDLSTFVTGGRSVAIAASRDIMMASSCGTQRLSVPQIAPALPGLAFSFARDWDICCTCAVMRACAYLGCGREPAACWAIDWLLDQQQTDGRFALPVQLPAGKTSPSSSLDATIDAVWTIAELNQPGFLLQPFDV